MYASELPASSVYAAYYRELSKYDVMALSLYSSGRSVRPVGHGCTGRPHLPADALIVDIGCGTGALLMPSTAGWKRLYGVDRRQGRSESRELFGLHNVTTGTLNRPPPGCRWNRLVWSVDRRIGTCP